MPEEAASGGPRGPTLGLGVAWVATAPPHGVVGWWVPLGCPGASLLHFMRRSFAYVFWIFSRNFISGQFSEFE
jgi:hypothetical protein